MQSVKRRPVWALMAILLAAATVFSGCAKRGVDVRPLARTFVCTKRNRKCAERQRAGSAGAV